jgi:hypothetical protein
MLQFTKPVFPKLFSTATQFLERQSIASHIALLDKEVGLKWKKYCYLLLNIILQKTPFLIMMRVWLVHLFPVTVNDGIDVHVSASYFQGQGVQQLQLVPKFGFHSYRCKKSNLIDVRRWEREYYLQRFSRKSWADSQNSVNFLRLKFIICSVYYVPYFLPFSNSFTFPFFMILIFI